MKSDLDRLMTDKQVDALLVTGPALHNPSMYYFTGGVHLTQGALLKQRGCPPVLLHYPMERDEAARTGLLTRNIMDYGYAELLKQENGNRSRALVGVFSKLFAEFGVQQGTVSLYGRVDLGPAFHIFNALADSLPGVNFVGESSDAVLALAAATKDAAEIERMRAVGKITTAVVGQVAEFITSHREKDGVMVKKDGSPLTVGEVKHNVNRWLLERGAENPEGCIFAIGRDAGVPHSAGNPQDVIATGKTIVFDIFPQESGGGYFYDFTRTWCVGHAPDEAYALYQDVLDCYKHVSSAFRAGTPCRDYQVMTCDFFRARGHQTVMDDPKVESGYVHSLGHGLGLNVHESPALTHLAQESALLQPGAVVTVEPGLYYPERGMGVRLEDTVWVTPEGRFETLAEYSMELVLMVRG
ncbi:MAG: aminopeptidase P family protein [Chloroflexi bacterium]|nr:aminopeptidase P family protein [Chloroflexota bacterium]